MEKIKPCPFCGDDDPEWESDENDPDRFMTVSFWLCCPDCGAAGPPAGSHQLAAEFWNERI